MTEPNDREWVIRYTDRRFEDHATLHTSEAQARREAAAILETLRLQANEWRGAMSDRERQFVTRTEQNLALDRVGKLERTQSESEGRQQVQMLVLSLIPTIISIAAFLYAVTQ